MDQYSTKRISSELIAEIKRALRNKHYGSVEIYVQDYKVTQITERIIKKLKEEKLSRGKTAP